MNKMVVYRSEGKFLMIRKSFHQLLSGKTLISEIRKHIYQDDNLKSFTIDYVSKLITYNLITNEVIIHFDIIKPFKKIFPNDEVRDLIMIDLHNFVQENEGKFLSIEFS